MIHKLKRFARRAISALEGDKQAAAPRVLGGLPPSFQKYKDYIDVHPSVLFGTNAALQLFDPPQPPRVCLKIGEGSHIFSTFSLLRRDARVSVGRNCQIGASHFIAAQQIDVADDVIMAWGSTIIDTDNHALDWEYRRHDVARCREAWLSTDGEDIGRLHDWSKVRIGTVSIGARSWIGFNSLVLKGVTVGEGAVIGAGSVVRRSIPDYARAYGNPCKVVSENQDHA